jgi:hypothetical protein
MGDQFLDIVMVLLEARLEQQRSAAFVAPSELRKNAVRTFAEKEHQRGRFKNLDSAEKSIHDACVRRLNPDVKTIAEFDRLLADWLAGTPRRFRDILSRHARTEQHHSLITAFLTGSDTTA